MAVHAKSGRKNARLNFVHPRWQFLSRALYIYIYMYIYFIPEDTHLITNIQSNI